MAVIFAFQILLNIRKIHEYEENGDQEKQKYLNLIVDRILLKLKKIS